MSLQKHAYATTVVGKDPSRLQLVFLGETTTEVIEGTTNIKDVPHRTVDYENDDYHEPDDNGDWSDLSPEEKEAALALGYTKAMWDNEGKNDLIDGNDWTEMSPEQMAALRVLGYSAFNW